MDLGEDAQPRREAGKRPEYRNSLGLLLSRPDPVGERFARSQLPAETISGEGCTKATTNFLRDVFPTVQRTKRGDFFIHGSFFVRKTIIGIFSEVVFFCGPFSDIARQCEENAILEFSDLPFQSRLFLHMSQ